MRPRPARDPWFGLLSLGLLWACGGSRDTTGRGHAGDEGPGASGSAPEECEVDGPARSPMRRLTPAELDRTLVDLLGVQAGKALAVLPPEQVGGFSNNVDVRTVGADTVSAIAHLASEVALEVTAEPGALLDCPTLFGDVELGAEAEAGETDTGLLMESHVELRSEGYVESVIEIAHGGEYGIEWRLYGTSCAGEGAEWTLWVDGDPVADGLAPAVWSWVGAVHALDAGSHQIRVSFDNDCYLPGTGEDRNLLVDAVRLSGRGLAIGSPDEFSDCVQTWLETFLVRAWRRPVEDPEILSGLVSLFESASAEWGEIAAVRMLIEVILQSPRFLYRVEDSVLGASPGEVVHLDGYEVASRLSYFLWGSMPDDTLLADAASGALEQPDGLQAAAERMLADPRAMEVVELFFSEWFALDHIGHVEKDLDVYPAWTEHRRASFREETIRFVRAVWEDGARFDELLTADWTIADAELADFYGLESNSDDWGRVERDPAHHAGLLTQGSFLAARARSYASSPIHRGLFIRGTLLCHVMSGPDPSLEIEVPDPDPEATTRELLEQHRSDPVCASCHDLIDPPGLAFEHFDGIGQFRMYENGHPVDASVDLTGTDVNGQFDGAAELGLALADSTMVQTCFAQQWFRFAHGRRPSDGDDCEIAATAQTFIADDLDMQSLVLATVASPAFRTAVGSP